MVTESLPLNRPGVSEMKKARALLRRLGFLIAVLALVTVVVGPFLWMLISSISPQIELSATPPHWLPKNPTLFRYEALFQGASQGAGELPAGVEKFLR
ncbi:MAG TPA: hypothetical protein VHO48_07350, partial [Anaerolineaceae bacterium]|nr:hypothetical protein [Anaerolineaceae bacterium]